MNISTQTKAFSIKGTAVSAEKFGNGHINETLKITTDTGNTYILQRINHYVFKEPVKVMENISRVTAYLLEKTGDPTAALHFVPTLNGDFCHLDEDGNYWRMYEFVEGFCLEAAENAEDFYESAVAFGRFQQQLLDFPANTLHETIPNFHNTVDRFNQLKASIEADPKGRAKDVLAEIEFALKHEEVGGTLQRMLENGDLPLRVTHNDTKLNNVLLNPKTRKPLCVLDLDTVMPGLSAHDFGDSIRFGAATAAEDEQDTSKMKLNLAYYESYAKGFLEAATALTDKEVEVLPYGALIMTLEVGIRFLKDYLDGDVYFKTAYPTHNLVRCRTQFALVADMEAKWDEMQAVINRLKAQRNSL